MNVIDVLKSKYTKSEDEYEFYKSLISVEIIEKVMAIFLLLIPCIVSIWTMVKKFNMYRNDYGVPHNLVYFVFFCIVSWIVLEIMILFDRKKIKSLDIVKLCLLAFLVRLLCAFLLNGVPEGDFLTYYKYACEPDVYREHMVPYFATYSFIVGIFMKLVNSTSAIIGMIFNAFFTSFIPGILFYAVKKYTKEEIAYLAAVLYSFFPSMILYSVCFSGENISQFLLVVLFLMLISLWDAEKEMNCKKICLYLILSCLCAALLNLFKPIFSMILLFIFVEEILYRIMPSVVKAIKEKNIVIMVKALVISGCILVLMIGANKLIFYCSAIIMENWYNTERISESSYGPGRFVEIAYAGLKEEGGGEWNEEVNTQVIQIYEQSKNYAEVSDKMKSIIVCQIKTSPSNFFKLLIRKIRISWADEWAFSYYSSAPKEGNVSLLNIPSSHFVLYVIPLIYMCIIYMGCIMEFVYKCLTHNNSSREEGTIYIFFGGFVLTFLILTAHERYKSTFMPLICIIASLGFYNCTIWIYAIICRFIRRLKQ